MPLRACSCCGLLGVRDVGDDDFLLEGLQRALALG